MKVLRRQMTFKGLEALKGLENRVLEACRSYVLEGSEEPSSPDDADDVEWLVEEDDEWDE